MSPATPSMALLIFIPCRWIDVGWSNSLRNRIRTVLPFLARIVSPGPYRQNPRSARSAAPSQGAKLFLGAQRSRQKNRIWATQGRVLRRRTLSRPPITSIVFLKSCSAFHASSAQCTSESIRTHQARKSQGRRDASATGKQCRDGRPPPWTRQKCRHRAIPRS